MVSNGNGERTVDVIEEASSSLNPNGSSKRADILNSVQISTGRERLLSNENKQLQILKVLSFIPDKARLFKIHSSGSQASSSEKFWQFAEERDEASCSVPSPDFSDIRGKSNGVLSSKIDWTSLWKMSQEWFRKPFNMVLFLWISCVGVSGAILFLVMTGMLNGVLPKKSQRNVWFEVSNQILNALFTLMCLYQHPQRFHHLILLFRWKPEDIAELQKLYCKNGTYKPNEWAHMMVVVVLLHVNCFAQYALCGLNLGYRRSARPAIGVGICISVAIAAPAIAGVYSILSPLGKDYESETDEEAQDHGLTAENKQPGNLSSVPSERRLSFASRNEQKFGENRPQWRGGTLDIWDDIVVAYLSLFCCFCVFGWNMDRLGFGNMYVHIATFILFCTAPFWIFTLAAVNIDNEIVMETMALTGIILCFFGLLYGGFWRIQMRKRFNLPENNVCCQKPAVADCAQWLCCCWCSLAQEVRTANFYDIVDEKFYRKEIGDTSPAVICPLPPDDAGIELKANPSSSHQNSPRSSRLSAGSSGSSRLSRGYTYPDNIIPLKKDASGMESIMEVPIFSVIHRNESYPQM